MLLETAPGAMPDSIVSACNALDGVRVLWISRYAAGGNVFLDLEAIEDLTAHPMGALDRLVDLLPAVFRADWGARVGRDARRPPPHRGAPQDVPWAKVDTTDRLEVDDDVQLLAATRLDNDEIMVIGRRGGPEFLDSELARLGHLAALALSISRSAAAAG